jgi:hypothetical protein
MSAGTAFSDLPVEVMQLVASSMCNRDWARFSRTCSAWQRMQPRSIVLWANGTSELRWLANHLEKAQLLNLNTGILDFTSEEVQQIMARCAQKVGRVKQLMLYGIDGREEPPSTPPWLQNFFRAVADSLDVMQLSIFPSLLVPPMRNLKHLVVELEAFYEHDLPRLSFLYKLPSLLTLSLGNMKDLPLPALDLTSCAHLQAVSLLHLVPVGLNVPASCSVALLGDWQAIAKHAKELCNTLTGLSIHNREGDFDATLSPALSSLVNATMMLTTLHIFTEGVGGGTVCQLSLGSNLRALREVLISCTTSLVLTVTAPLSLRVLGAIATGALRLVLDHPDVLAASLSWLNVYSSECNSTSERLSCPALLEALGARSCSQVRDSLQRLQASRHSHLYFPAGVRSHPYCPIGANKPRCFWLDTPCWLKLSCGACSSA